MTTDMNVNVSRPIGEGAQTERRGEFELRSGRPGGDGKLTLTLPPTLTSLAFLSILSQALAAIAFVDVVLGCPS